MSRWGSISRWGPPEPLERDERREPQRYCQWGVQHQQPEEPDEQHLGRGEVGELAARHVEEQRAAHPEPARPHQHGAQDSPRQGREVPYDKEDRRGDSEEHRQRIEAHIEADTRRGLAEPQPAQAEALPTDPRGEADLDQPRAGVHPGRRHEAAQAQTDPRMGVPPLRDGAPQKRQPDQAEGRHLIRPGEGPVQDVAAEDPGGDTPHLQEHGHDGRRLDPGRQEHVEAAAQSRGAPWAGVAARTARCRWLAPGVCHVIPHDRCRTTRYGAACVIAAYTRCK